ncbi:MAG TPA: HAMP domain-containing protein, partial [Leptospiraceae bacterium]|nr:HAMP domain-containing protein [Leptospiraceae bacterium]
MKAYIRTRLLLGIILSALLVSGLLGIFIYKQSADIFIEINQRVQGEVATNTDLPLEIKNRIMNSAMIASILILFFILVFSFFQVNHILKSLQILSEEIDKLQASDYNYTIQFRKKDELGMIAEVLNQMSIRMKQLKEDT